MQSRPLPELIDILLGLDFFHYNTSQVSALEEELRTRITDASDDELVQGLHELWKCLRHVAREDCWEALREDMPHIQQQGSLRHEIRAHLDNTPPNLKAREFRDLRRRDPTAASARLKDMFKDMPVLMEQHEEYMSRIHRSLCTLSGRLHGETDPMLRHMPPQKELTGWGWLDEDDAVITAQDAFSGLRAITEAYRAREVTTPLFWGVLGPVQDALLYESEDTFGEVISRARLDVLRMRGRQGQADLGDHWLWLIEETTPAGAREAVDRMLTYLQAADPAEVEVFLRHCDDFEDVFPQPDRFWNIVLRRETNALSWELLGRAGDYYWRHVQNHHGWPLALATVGLQCEFGSDWSTLPPFLPLWAAARDAAQYSQWDLARDCLNRSLLDMAAWAQLRDKSARDEQIEEFRYDSHFLQPLRTRSNAPEVTRECVRFAWRVLDETNFPQIGALRNALQHVARVFDIKGLAAEFQLRVVLGPLWNALHDSTQYRLVFADCLWKFCEDEQTQDYSAVGNEYRRAIESEWIRHLEPRLRDIMASMQRKSSFGSVLSALREDRGLLRALIAGQIGRTHALVDPGLIGRVQNAWADLNSAAHSSGLDREQCHRLREALLRGGLLRVLLSACLPEV